MGKEISPGSLLIDPQAVGFQPIVPWQNHRDLLLPQMPITPAPHLEVDPGKRAAGSKCVPREKVEAFLTPDLLAVVFLPPVMAEVG